MDDDYEEFEYVFDDAYVHISHKTDMSQQISIPRSMFEKIRKNYVVTFGKAKEHARKKGEGGATANPQ